MSDELILAQAEQGLPVTIDVDRLVGTHMCIAATSGGGKSWRMRRLLEYPKPGFVGLGGVLNA
jgi:DNA helicase HerA-like ATPase